MPRYATLFLIASTLTACAAAKMTPAQSRAWDAFQDCRKLAPTANLRGLTPEGGISVESREDDLQIMQKCLSERHGDTSR